MKAPPLVSLLCLLCLLAMALAICGCRSSEVMSCRVALPEGLTSCGDISIRQTLDGRDIGVEQGKTVEAAASAAASVAATLRDITASQSGNATGGSDTGDGGAEAAATNPPDAPPEPTTVAAASQPPPAAKPAEAGATAGKEGTAADPGGD